MMRSLGLAFFWGAASLILYTYIGYPLLLALLTRRDDHEPPTATMTPAVDVLIAAYNEAHVIEAKLDNTLALDYPPERLQITVVTDGSTDDTPARVASFRPRGVVLLHQPERQGKGAALARALPHLSGEIILFTDANCMLSPDVLCHVIPHFDDPRVGGVSGAKRVLEKDGTPGGEGLYWRYESALKALDARFGSVMGAPGEIWAARREAYRPPPPDVVLDDFYASLDLVARGWRLDYAPSALSYEAASPSLSAEWRRRVRNAAGGWQAITRLDRVWRGGARLVFQYLSHRVLRWVVVPPLLAVLLLANLSLAGEAFYTLTLLLQLGFYLIALAGGVLLGAGKTIGWLGIPFYVCLLNGAALVGGWRYLRGRQTVLWDKVRP